MSRLPHLGERTSFDFEGHDFDRKAYLRDMAELTKLAIWTGDGARALWEHQKQAIAFGAAFSRLGVDVGEGGLVKMPTGTGKSGIVAVLSRCLPHVRKVLVLTPREGLVTQMRKDIARRFWQHMGLCEAGNEAWSGSGVHPGAVRILLPRMDLAKLAPPQDCDGRIVLVGTLQALDQARSGRDRLARDERRGELSEKDAEKFAHYKAILSALAKFDLVLVDEGHYEPAPSWSRSVRELGVRTLLLSATPFRNDYKLFSVQGHFAFNFPYQDARERKIVREVEFCHADVADVPADAPELDRRNRAQAFAKAVAERGPDLLARFPEIRAKIIVRAGGFSTLQLIQQALNAREPGSAVLIHERVSREDRDKLRFRKVAQAQSVAPEATYWLHEEKLLEGIDDPTFIAVAILDPFANDRQLVQQIGRVLRSTDPERLAAQLATVIVRDDREHRATVRAWEQYLEFEAAGAESISSIIPGEALLPQEIVKRMPAQQYAGGGFRERLPLDMALSRDDILLPKSAAIFAIESGFDQSILEAEAKAGILARNRFVIRAVEDMPAGTQAWTFFTVDESRYLANHYVTEWRFGLSLVVRVGDRLFAFDSDGIPFDPKKCGVRRLRRSEIAALFARDRPGRRSRITRIAAHSLELSERAIRTMTTSTASFEETFSDLLDTLMLPSQVSGYVGGVGRYLGLTRSRVSDQAPGLIHVDAWLDWAAMIDSELSDGAQPSRVFERFAQLAVPDPDKAGKPTNILLDLEPLLEAKVIQIEVDGGDNISAPGDPTADLCADINANKFKLKMADGDEIDDCAIEYKAETGRYAITSEKLNARAPTTVSASGKTIALTERINSRQAFRILTEQQDVVFMHGEWVRARPLVQGGRVPTLELASGVKALDRVVSEKGEGHWLTNENKWRSESIFGLCREYLDHPPKSPDSLAAAIEEFPLVLLDDDGQELADFILVSPEKVVLLHAKAAKGAAGSGVTAIQEVGRQVSASLAFFLATNPDIADDRWTRKYTANKVKIPNPKGGHVRVFRNSDGRDPAKLGDFVKSAFQDRSRSKEVWMVAANLLSIDKLKKEAKKPEVSNRTRQMLMYLDSIATACGRANARFRIFANN